MGPFAANDRNTVRSLFEASVAGRPTQPLLTYYDDATGERTELSGATLDNWVAKTANLLIDGCGLGEADLADVWLPPHWQTAAVLLGCWSAGLTVAFGAATGAGAAVAFASATVVTAGESTVFAPPASADRYVLGLAPLGAPLRTAIPGWLDYIAEVRVHGDRYTGPAVAPGTAALVGADGGPVSQQALVALARARATELGVPTGGRIVVDAGAYPDPKDWLLPALAAGSSLVLCVNVDAGALDKRAASEHADAILGPVE